MLSLIGRWLGALSAIGLVACGQTDSLVGAMDPSVAGRSQSGGGSGGSAGMGAARGGTAGKGTTSGGGASGGLSGGDSNAGGSGGAGAGTAGAAGSGAIACESSLPVAPRLVRLTFAQMTASVGALLGDSAAQQVRVALASELEVDRAFPPLASPGEGSTVTDQIFSSSDQLAQVVGTYVLDHFAEVTRCGDAPTVACAQAFVSDFTERVYRRPPSDAELANIAQVFTEAQGLQATTQEAVSAAVTAMFDSPIFVYREEFAGAPRAGESLPLRPYEMANELSFFLTNGPPDAALLAAAKQGALGTAEERRPHVDRLLVDAATRANLETSVGNYFGLPRLENITHLDSEFPQLRASMQAESRAFLARRLWEGPLAELVTSRRARVDAGLAALYGVPFPPPGGAVDALGFADVELPAERSGLLTQAAMLTIRSLFDRPAAAARGLWVNGTLACFSNNPPSAPASVDETLQPGVSEQEGYRFIESTSPCSGCHQNLDPIGLALGNFDAIGRYRTLDSDGLPVDASGELSLLSGVESFEGAQGLSRRILQDDRLATCLTKNFLGYALGEGALIYPSNCSVREMVNAFKAGNDPAFSGILRQIALSDVLSIRKP